MAPLLGAAAGIEVAAEYSPAFFASRPAPREWVDAAIRIGAADAPTRPRN